MRAQLDKLTAELDQLADDTKKQTTITDKDLKTAYSVRTLEAKAQRLNHRMQSLNVKWDAFNASYLGFISENDIRMVNFMYPGGDGKLHAVAISSLPSRSS